MSAGEAVVPLIERAHWRTDLLACAVFVVIVAAMLSVLVCPLGWPYVGLLVGVVWLWSAFRMASEASAWVWERGRR